MVFLYVPRLATRWFCTYCTRPSISFEFIHDWKLFWLEVSVLIFKYKRPKNEKGVLPKTTTKNCRCFQNNAKKLSLFLKQRENIRLVVPLFSKQRQKIGIVFFFWNNDKKLLFFFPYYFFLALDIYDDFTVLRRVLLVLVTVPFVHIVVVIFLITL